MIFTLDVIRARKGDCLMVHYGSEDDPHLVMIDGGPKSVYAPHLKPRIEQIRKDRQLKKTESLTVDLLMVSHVDDDHIQGILDLTREMREDHDAQRPQLIQVLDFWHNSFENIINHTPDELTASFTSRFPAAVGGDPPNDMTVDRDDEDEETITSTLKVLASIQQGAQLRHDAELLEFPRNIEFDEKLVLAEGNNSFDMDNGLTFTVVGPMLPELKKLHQKHQEWLKELKAQGKEPEDALADYVDKSVPNLSSIVVLAEVEGKKILLTGDARGDKVLEGLELVELVEPGGKLEVDILKVPHHGSANNLDDDFFERIIAKHYVFSGNGEHGNPERESLEMLLAARGNANYQVHLTYPVEEIDTGRKADWQKEQNKEKKKKEKNPNKKVRPNWSPAKHSLASLFKNNKDFAKKVRIVSEDEPHLINLLDEM
jgi:beta-lactamase superfamily II metal-dependent hydrolase